MKCGLSRHGLAEVAAAEPDQWLARLGDVRDGQDMSRKQDVIGNWEPGGHLALKSG